MNFVHPAGKNQKKRFNHPTEPRGLQTAWFGNETPPTQTKKYAQPQPDQAVPTHDHLVRETELGPQAPRGDRPALGCHLWVAHRTKFIASEPQDDQG